jgi:predicted enzyme related to lactoylglutathione lyase
MTNPRFSVWVRLRTSIFAQEFDDYRNTQVGNRSREIHRKKSDRGIWYCGVIALIVFLFLLPAILKSSAQADLAQDAAIAVGAQYDSTHVYVAPDKLDTFVKSFVATFGGQPSKRTVTNVLPVPSSTEFQYIWTPVGTLSVFAFQTPIPYPFGLERTGYLVTDMDVAIKSARLDGADVIVEPFKDPIGIDAVIQWPGGLKMQLYWHFTAPDYPPLETVPDNRVYLSRDAADRFVTSFLKFSRGKVISDDKHSDAGEIGRPSETYRRIRIASLFGNMQVMVTDGHLPYPFGHEITGYQVQDLDTTLEKAKAAGAKVLSTPYKTFDRTSAIVVFPGGYIAEIHGIVAH